MRIARKKTKNMGIDKKCSKMKGKKTKKQGNTCELQEKNTNVKKTLELTGKSSKMKVKQPKKKENAWENKKKRIM